MICIHSFDKSILILFSIIVCLISDNVQGGRRPQSPSNIGSQRGPVTSQTQSEKIVYPNDFLIEHAHFSHPRYHDHRGEFQHTPEFHDPNFVSRRNQKNSTTENDQKNWNETTKYIPLEFIKIINEHNVSDLLLNYIEDDDKGSTIIRNRFAEEASERSESSKDAGKIPKPAGCSPEVATIPLKSTTDPSVLYIPQCTKVERCSGCCTHPLLSCQPTKTEMLTYQVLKTQYNGQKKLKLLGKEIVLVEKHVSCKCGCKIKEEVLKASCNKYQEYRASECQCVCVNTDEENKCYKNNNKKLWNPDLCACQCREVFQCSTGQYFDNNECKCLTMPVRRRFATVPDTPSMVEDDY